MPCCRRLQGEVFSLAIDFDRIRLLGSCWAMEKVVYEPSEGPHMSRRQYHRIVEDFTEFAQRTAYFDGDQVSAAGARAERITLSGHVVEE
jgi:hypothetical protein